MKFRKKPIIIDAILWDETKETFEILTNMGMKYGSFNSHEIENYVKNLRIQTIEGCINANRGDWIIKRVAGEFYPCKPDIFEKTYEPVN